jgi:hypothetical protein
MLPNINILTDPSFQIRYVQRDTIYMDGFQMLAILLYLSNLDSINKIKKNINKFEITILTIINIVSSVSLSLTGLIDMSIKYIHLDLQVFFSYTAFIFWWGFKY